MIKVYKEIVKVGHFKGYDWVTIETIEDANEVERYCEEARKDTTDFRFGAYFSKEIGVFRFSYIELGNAEETEILDKVIQK